MKLKIRNDDEAEIELWLVKEYDGINLKSKKFGKERYEFVIKNDGSWTKIQAGNLCDKENK